MTPVGEATNIQATLVFLLILAFPSFIAYKTVTSGIEVWRNNKQDNRVRPFAMRVIHSCKTIAQTRMVLDWLENVTHYPPPSYCREYVEYLTDSRRLT